LIQDQNDRFRRGDESIARPSADRPRDKRHHWQ
jgi:hypothetical protein